MNEEDVGFAIVGVFFLLIVGTCQMGMIEEHVDGLNLEAVELVAKHPYLKEYYNLVKEDDVTEKEMEFLKSKIKQKGK